MWRLSCTLCSQRLSGDHSSPMACWVQSQHRLPVAVILHAGLGEVVGKAVAGFILRRVFRRRSWPGSPACPGRAKESNTVVTLSPSEKLPLDVKLPASRTPICRPECCLLAAAELRGCRDSGVPLVGLVDGTPCLCVVFVEDVGEAGRGVIGRSAAFQLDPRDAKGDALGSPACASPRRERASSGPADVDVIRSGNSSQALLPATATWRLTVHRGGRTS